jgi:hypothetical protein
MPACFIVGDEFWRVNPLNLFKGFVSGIWWNGWVDVGNRGLQGIGQ